MRSFVPAICPGSKHQFSAQIKGEDSFFLLFLAGFYRIISLLQKKSGKGKK